jgi:hypothetical protein
MESLCSLRNDKQQSFPKKPKFDKKNQILDNFGFFWQIWLVWFFLKILAFLANFGFILAFLEIFGL